MGVSTPYFRKKQSMHVLYRRVLGKVIDEGTCPSSALRSDPTT